MVTSRDDGRVSQVKSLLEETHGDRVYGTTADVTRPESVAALAEFATQHLGRAGRLLPATP
jgi:NAD(P)-dependent dehydrogenase (short-subunit alcohol dehydrogenase family)